MVFYYFKFDPPISVLSSEDEVEAMYSKRFNYLKLEYEKTDGGMYLTGGGVITDEIDLEDLKQELYLLGYDVVQRNKSGQVPTVEIESSKKINIAASEGAYSFEFNATFDEPVYIQITEGGINYDNLNKKAVEKIYTLKGNRLLVTSFEFYGDGIKLTGVKGRFDYVVDCLPGQFKEYLSGIVSYVLSSLDETYPFYPRSPLFSEVNYSLVDIVNLPETGRIIINKTCNLTISLEIEAKKEKLTGKEFSDIGKKLLSELKKQVQFNEWEITLLKENIEYADDFKSAKLNYVIKFKKLKQNALPIVIVSDENGKIAGAVGTVIVILSLLVALGIINAYIVKSIKMFAEESAEAFSDLASSVPIIAVTAILFSVSFILYMIYKIIKQ
ncbi:MAG TPA: hypothetical protein DCG38_11775 [Eubacteriaceae bacterium]|nr:hypothetical protein [Eubacteriaceae bacterium]